ncbi:protease A inhibitor 3 [Monosporozyma unispora]
MGISDKAYVGEILKGQKEKLSGEAKVMSENLGKLNPKRDMTDEERKLEKEHNNEQYSKLMGAGKDWIKKKEQGKNDESL